MLIFHPEVHLPYFRDKAKILHEKAAKKEIILLFECKEYKKSESFINGFESLHDYPDLLLCSTYQMSQVPFITLREGGSHSIAVLVFFLCSIIHFPELRQFIERFKEDTWFSSLTHFLIDVDFDIYDYDNLSDNMKAHVRKRVKYCDGLPSNVPYSVILEGCKYTITQRFPEQNIDEVLTSKTLIEREENMAKNIIDAVSCNKSNKDIHVIIGAGHLMPFLSINQVQKLGLDIFFQDYHNSINNKRLLHHLQEIRPVVQYSIELL